MPTEVKAEPMPVQIPAPAEPTEVRDAPAAALANHDQTGKVNVDFPDKFNELREFVLMFNKPNGLLIAEDEVELRGDSLFIFLPAYPVFTQTENGREIERDRLGWRSVPLDGLDPREILLEFFESGTRQRRNGDGEGFDDTE